MKTIILISALFLALFSSAQQNIENNTAIDSSLQQQSSNYKRWYKVSLAEIGGGGAYLNSDGTNTQTQYSGLISSSLLPFAIGFQKLGGLGFGTKAIEFFEIQERIDITSYAPVYAYYPIYLSKKTKKEPGSDYYKIPSMINFYVGGSLWCDTSTSTTDVQEIIKANKFCHIGVNYMFFNFSTNDGHPLGNGNFSLEAGMIFFDIKNSNLKNIFHISLLYNFVGFAIKPYK
ncbi:hypothetical protein [Flavobacterium nackdongense]|uniref:Outer membrane protein beta-barrel domain-containing protein n=1 Tax=Flavobacterium nackdongense TaxID=2547394 RepID=A0A4P6YHD0_9FLAO|nr:hypothetical protein [Flavobacterium nackdongense]QBN20344.1 hypothetical protein E1750_16605 [Flavobacterium nackdongense]